MNRRNFLRLTFGTGLLASAGYILKEVFIPAQLDVGERRTLEAFLDTLIPATETPGALQLGVAEKILAASSDDAQYRRLIKKGCGWLDGKAKSRGVTEYLLLGEREREDVVGGAAGAPAGTLARIFFERLRSDAFYHYYAHPASWRGFGYQGPPQPDGYPDYIKPQSFLS